MLSVHRLSLNHIMIEFRHFAAILESEDPPLSFLLTHISPK